MKKVILNKCYGGFDVSPKGYYLYAKKKGKNLYIYDHGKGLESDIHKLFKVSNEELEKWASIFTTYLTKDYGDVVENWTKTINEEDYLRLNDDHREDKTLIEVVEELGDEASSSLSRLVIVEIPDDLDYVIDDYDGIETLHQKVQEW